MQSNRNGAHEKENQKLSTYQRLIRATELKIKTSSHTFPFRLAHENLRRNQISRADLTELRLNKY